MAALQRQACIAGGVQYEVRVLGTGTVGRVIGSRPAELGHEVTIGTLGVDTLLAGTEPDAMGNEPFASWRGKHPEIVLGTINFGDITTARGTEMCLPLWLRLWGALGTGTFNISVAR